MKSDPPVPVDPCECDAVRMCRSCSEMLFGVRPLDEDELSYLSTGGPMLTPTEPITVARGVDELFALGRCCGACRCDDECACHITEAEDGERGCVTHAARV